MKTDTEKKWMLQNYVVSAFEIYNKYFFPPHCSQKELFKCCTKGKEVQVFSYMLSGMLSHRKIVRNSVHFTRQQWEGQI